MIVIQGQFDGKEIHLPEEAKSLPPGKVMVVFEEEDSAADVGWLTVQEQTFAKAWDDEEDAIYDEA